MREIIFRGKRIDNGEWVEGCLVYDSQHTCIRDFGLEYFEVIPETVGEFTGLTDKNDKKIFEGDIVKADYDGEWKKVYEVIFYDGGYKMRSKECNTLYDYSIHDEHPCFEVIGNIHDNPELLEIRSRKWTI